MLKKQITIIKRVEDIPVFLNLNSISNFRKQNLLENKIPFILKDKMVYLPFMATLLTDEQCEENTKIEKLTLALNFYLLGYYIKVQINSILMKH